MRNQKSCVPPVLSASRKKYLVVVIFFITVPFVKLQIRGSRVTNEFSLYNWNNVSGTFTYTSALPFLIECSEALTPPATPTSLPDLLFLVRDALQHGYHLKPLGNLHASSDLICTDGVPISMRKINHFSYIESTKQVKVGAGSTLHILMEQLHLRNRTLFGLPSYSDVTIGGALGTGVFGGTGIDHPASISDQISAITVVDGRGNIREIKDRHTLRAFKTNLGLLGIIYEVTLITIPQYKLHIQNTQLSDDVLWNGKIFESMVSTDWFQFWWFPSAKKVVLSEGIRVPLQASGNCQTHFIPEAPRGSVQALGTAVEIMQDGHDHFGFYILQALSKLSLFEEVPGRSPIFTENGKTMCNPAIGFSHRMTSNRCNVCAWDHGRDSLRNMQFEVAIPLKEFMNAVKTLRQIFDEYPVEFPLNGVFFKFLRESDSLLGLNSDRDSVSIELVLAPRIDRFRKPMMGLPVEQAVTQALIHRHKGRSHWGKNGLFYTSDYRLVRQLFEHFPVFVEFMKEFDPQGVFLNNFGRRLINPDYHKTGLDRYVQHCALVDNCVCQVDEDCGNGRPNSYMCGELLGYNVCRERGSYDSRWKERRVKNYKLFRGQVIRGLMNKISSN